MNSLRRTDVELNPQSFAWRNYLRGNNHESDGNLLYIGINGVREMTG